MLCSFIPDLETNILFKNVSQTKINQCFPPDSYTLKEFVAGEIAYSQSNGNPQVAYILEGSARVYTGENEESALLRTLNRSDVFGVANLYDGEPFPSYIVTATNAKILFINGEAFKAFLESTPDAMKNYLTLLSDKIVYLNKKIAVLTAANAEKKLALYIYEHMINGEFSPETSLSELASVLQMGRASLYRAIDELTEKKIIQKQGKRITVLDENKLKKL